MGEYDRLSDDQKQALCKDLLAEFGVTTARVQSNGEMIHSCPLPFGQHSHGDRNPSASLNYKKLVFNCLGCGNSGSLLWFIATCRGERTSEARKWLGAKTGLSDVQGLSDLLSFFDSLYAEGESAPPMPRMDPSVLDRWMFLHPYMTEIRGIAPEVLMDFKVGYDSKLDRIVIPHFWKGNLVGWQTRRLAKDGSPKYKSSPDFPKALTLYNDASLAAPYVVVVESPMSVLAKHHMENLTATFGASVTTKQIRAISRVPTVYLFFDNDQAGWKATYTVGRGLAAYCDVKVAMNPFAADAADLDDQTFATAIAQAEPFALWRPPSTLEVWPQEEDMSIKKHGHGEIIPEDDETKKEAGKKDWTADDAAALKQENEDADA